MPYTPQKPTLTESSDDLRARIPGWGVDLDPKDRPAVPRERREPTGAHWEFPERQPERRPREMSIEHKFLTPVFGTSCPPKGLSGVIRKFAYRKYSEGRAAHWLLLIGADRVDAAEERLRSLVSRRPELPAHGTGLRSEFTHHGLSSRLRRNRTDVVHQALDPVIVAAPWIVAAGAAYLVYRRFQPSGKD